MTHLAAGRATGTRWQIDACDGGGDRFRRGIYLADDLKAFVGKSTYLSFHVDPLNHLGAGIACSSLCLFEKDIAPIEIECHSWAWVTLLAIR